MSLGHGSSIVRNGLIFNFDMQNTGKSWKGAPTTNVSLDDGQAGTSPWSGDGTPTSLGIDPVVTFRGRKVAKFLTGTGRNCYINGATKLSTSTLSTDWTSTFFLKRVDGATLSSVGMYLYITNNTNVNQIVTLTPVEDGWYKATYSRTGLASGYPSLAGMSNLGAATQYYFADWQVEPMSISTPYVSGIRSNTQAAFDLSNAGPITIQGATYAADNTFSFAAAGQRLDTSMTTFGNDMTWEAWIKSTGAVNNTYNMFMGRTLPYFSLYNNERLFFSNMINGVQQTVYAPARSATTNKWYHATFTMSFDGVNTTMKVYTNGSQSASSVFAGSQSAGSGGLAIGDGRTGTSWYPFNGQVQVVRVYNRTLSASEIKQNFEALRGRYGV